MERRKQGSTIKYADQAKTVQPRQEVRLVTTSPLLKQKYGHVKILTQQERYQDKFGKD